MDFKESTYVANKEVKYVLEEAEFNKDYLVIVFSGFATKQANPPYRYNYIRTLRQIDCNKLFILDNDGPRGSYYLGKAMRFDFEESVSALIEDVITKLGVKRENVITAGTSKGGSAALYYGLKYNMGKVIAGAPQTKIASYVLSINGDTPDYMLGDKEDKNKIQELNNLITEQLKRNNDTFISLLASENDKQHAGHIVPFVEEMEKCNHPYEILVDNAIKDHSDIARFFPEFFVRKLLNMMFSVKIHSFNYQLNSDKYNIQTEVEIPSNMAEQINLYSHDKLIERLNPNENLQLSLNLKLEYPSKIDVVYTINDKDNIIYKKELGQYLISEKNVICKPEIRKENERTIKFDLNLETGQKLKYAFYVYRNGKVFEKIMYQKKQTLTYVAEQPGKYLIKYFILLPTGEKIVDKSDQVEII